MRDYSKISPAFWTGDTGKLLREFGHDAQFIALYLLTCQAANMIGLYYLPMPTLVHETGITLERAKEIMSFMNACGFAVYDDDSEFVFVINMASNQIGETLKVKDNRRISVVKMLAESQKASPVLASLFFDRYAQAYGLDTPIYPHTASHARIPNDVAETVMKRDKYRCKECKKEGSARGPQGVLWGSERGTQLHFDHIIAKINGGKTHTSNIQLLCKSCNSKKSALDRKLFWETHLGGHPEPLTNPLARGPEGVADPLRSQEQDQDQDQEQEQDLTDQIRREEIHGTEQALLAIIKAKGDHAIVRRVAWCVSAGLISQASAFSAANGVRTAERRPRNVVGYFVKILKNEIADFDALLSRAPLNGDL